MSVDFDVARKVAEAVMYEGYMLYPYRASAKKNKVRWQFGVVVPRPFVDQDPSEAWFNQTECLLEPGEDVTATLEVRLRFLQAQGKTVEEAVDGGFRPVESLEVNGTQHVSWDEAVEREAALTASLDDLLRAEQATALEIEGAREVEELTGADGSVLGRVVRETWPLSAALRVSAEAIEGPYGIVKLRIRTENLTEWGGPGDSRDEALRRSLLSTHTMFAVTEGRFVSLLDPPQWARPASASCSCVDTFPVLVGDPDRSDMMLSSRIILYDYPQIAPESPADLYDATEIDEILSLRTMTLTDEEKREARATDPRAAALIDRVDNMPQELLERLHGTVRYLRDVTEGGGRPEVLGGPELGGPGEGNPGGDGSVPWWDPGQDASVSPESDAVDILGTLVKRGSRVRLRPRGKGADAQDMFLIGKTALVEAVFFDVDGRTHLAVTLEGDPGADLHAWYGRYHYFTPDEVEPVEAEAGEGT